MEKKKLKPLDFSEDKKKYEAFEEKVELNPDRCDHRSAKVVNNRLQCTCGAGWEGSQIHKLAKALGISV